VVKYAAEKRIPVHARGAGTGLAGESLGRGLMLDFSKSMRRIVRTEAESVRVQPGVVHGLLNEHLAEFGRTFGPNPANETVTTMGSVIAIDGSGSDWLKYGSARQHVESLQVVLADGTVMEVGREPIPFGGNGQPSPGVTPTAAELVDMRRRDLVGRLRELLWRESALIAEHQPRSLLNRCGYQLADVLGETYVDMARLLCGSEGTLALITEATLATQPLPRHRGVVMLLFDRLENAAQAVPEILAFNPCACDLLDRRHLSLARETSPEYEVLIPADTEALLLVEYSGDDPVLVRERLAQTVDRLCRKKQLAFESHQATDPAEVQTFWQLARRVVPTLHRLRGTSRPVPIVEDVTVLPEVLPEFLVRMQNTLKRHQVTASATVRCTSALSSISQTPTTCGRCPP
jgi:FAD/FMN-containing dehydrogenase